MKTTLRKGQITDSGFEILDVVELAELGAGDSLPASGVWARHQKSGVQVFHVYNDDPENLFSFAFATAPEDNTGAPHILEHSVLCGSERYPLKDAFLILAQGSLQTFLNAWTFPDKTVYPASSVNEHDYFNLMSVYGDAVFRPLLSEWTFLQEGHRLFFSPGEETHKSGGLSITGVVYNEMRGAYSSQDAYSGLWSVKAVLPGTPYAFESGGDPEHIPELSWEGLREFHRKRYAPANCRIFLAGNIPTETQLAFLDRQFFSSREPGAAAPPIPKAARWTEPQNFRVPCPAGGEQKSTVFLSWLCGDAADTVETLALAALAETLLGHDGSPLTRALIESGLGEDLAPVSGLEGEIRETLFALGLRGVDTAGAGPDSAAARHIQDLILGELERLVREGIPPEEIEAALLSMEFSHREIRRSGGPFSLVWMRRSLRGWIHGAAPWESLLFVPPFTQVKERLAADPRYFESLIRTYLLDNPHRALVAVEPEPGFLEKQEAALARSLREKETAFSEEERRAVREKNAALEQFQSDGDSPEALATIPHLSRRDLSPEIEIIPRNLEAAGGAPVLTHDLFTNGIIYADIAFPLDIFPPEDYPWLPFFSRAVVSVGLPGKDYAEVSGLLARTAGGFHAILQSGSSAPGAARTIPTPAGIFDLAGRDWLCYRLKALDEKFDAALDLARQLITEADFSDQRRVRDLVVEMKNEADSSLAPLGHHYASGRSSRGFSRTRMVDEVWNGLGQINFAHWLAETDTAEICWKLTALRDAAAGAGIVANLTGSAAALKPALAALGRGNFGPPRPRNPRTTEGSAFAPLLDHVPGQAAGPQPETPAPGKAEVYASPSLQVGFAAQTLAAAPYDTPAQAAEIVLAHLLSTGALWEDIRMKGGAYGAFAQPDHLEGCFSFSTYRDPNPLRSLGSFSGITGSGGEAGKAGKIKFSDDEVEKAIIGCYGRETRPRTAAEKGTADFSRFLYRIEDVHRSRKLERLIAVEERQVSAALDSLASRTAAPPVIVAGTAAAEKAAAKLGAELKVLPV
ncbi:MAG: insulinase family protein [Treponema sp.]|jgi:Zn-dependent M16 (insulinase) family peptidase|nr:insulinase family protein [Treponema sp.]